MEYYGAAVGAFTLYGYVKTAVKGYQLVSNTAAAATETDTTTTFASNNNDTATATSESRRFDSNAAADSVQVCNEIIAREMCVMFFAARSTHMLTMCHLWIYLFPLFI